MRISDSQLELVNNQIHALIAADNFYGRKLKAAGVSGVDSPESFEALPFSEKGSDSKASGESTPATPAAFSLRP